MKIKNAILNSNFQYLDIDDLNELQRELDSLSHKDQEEIYHFVKSQLSVPVASSESALRILEEIKKKIRRAKEKQ